MKKRIPRNPRYKDVEAVVDSGMILIRYDIILIRYDIILIRYIVILAMLDNLCHSTSCFPFLW